MLSADLRGAKRLTLLVTAGGDGIDFDHADWAGASAGLAADGRGRSRWRRRRRRAAPPAIARENSPQPAIHGPRIIGTTPGRPFLFLVPATGQAPLELLGRESARRAVARPGHRHHHAVRSSRPGTTVVEVDREERPGQGRAES